MLWDMLLYSFQSCLSHSAILHSCTHWLTMQVEVDDRIELVIQGCTLQGAPAAPKHPDDLCLGGLMYIGSYSSVSITGSRLICLYNPLVKWWVCAHVVPCRANIAAPLHSLLMQMEKGLVSGWVTASCGMFRVA
jgi:hypothetical protein